MIYREKEYSKTSKNFYLSCRVYLIGDGIFHHILLRGFTNRKFLTGDFVNIIADIIFPGKEVDVDWCRCRISLLLPLDRCRLYGGMSSKNICKGKIIDSIFNILGFLIMRFIREINEK